MDVSLAGLLVNMSLNPLFCEDLIALNAVEGLLGIIDSTYKVDHVDSKSNVSVFIVAREALQDELTSRHA